MIERTTTKDTVPREYLFTEIQERITLMDGTELNGTGALNSARGELGLTVKASQPGYNSPLTISQVSTLFGNASKAARIVVTYSNTEYNVYEGYTQLVTVRKVGNAFYLTLIQGEESPFLGG